MGRVGRVALTFFLFFEVVVVGDGGGGFLLGGAMVDQWFMIHHTKSYDRLRSMAARIGRAENVGS